jgi:hypothetical protein
VLTVEIASWKDKRLNPKLPFARVAYVVREREERAEYTHHNMRKRARRRRRREIYPDWWI